MTFKKSTAFLLIVIAILLLLFSGCADVITNRESDKMPISPVADASQKDSVKLGLLFKFHDSLLAPETRNLDVAAGENVETAIVNALIQGPSEEHPDLQTTISPDTRVLSVKNTGQYLEVTLSKEFLSPVSRKQAAGLTVQEASGEKMQSQKIAVYSIVNTLIQYGSSAKVLILVDTTDSGTGERVTREQFGFSGNDQQELMEPLAFNMELMTTPNRVGNLFFDAICSKNWEEAYSLVARQDLQIHDAAQDDQIIQQLANGSISIQKAALSEVNVASDGQTALLLADYTYLDKTQNSNQVQGFPVQMIQQKEIWKISYDSFATLMGLK